MQVWCTLKFKTCFFCPCAGLVHFEVQNFCFLCPCAGLVHFEVQNLCFFVPAQVLCTLQLQPSVCFVPVEVWYDSWFAIKMYFFHRVLEFA